MTKPLSGGEGSSADRPGDHGPNGLAAREPGGRTEPSQVVVGRARAGMFGVHDTGDTSGFGGLRLPAYAPVPAERPYGGWFDEFVDQLRAAMADRGIPDTAIRQVTVERGEITLYIRREHIVDLCETLRNS
ncbi:MAG: NADH-quinone oxidoreductase subunit C, partial [Pseudonocardia sp.]|nr:NADH-quinone oxidoreductase subunit C [Pseudonocardia sp.]